MEQEIAERRRRTTKGRRGYGIGVLVVACLVTSFGTSIAMAEVLTQTPLSQQLADYSVSSHASVDFPNAPTVNLTETVTSGCYGGGPAVTYPGAPGVNYIDIENVRAMPAGENCTVGDQAEEFIWESPIALETESVKVEVFVTLGNVTYSPTLDLNVTGGTATGQPYLWLYVDLGTTIPAAGIDQLSVVMT